MPNHVKNRITGTPELIDMLIGVGEDGNHFVDFNKIVPRPDAIVNESVGCHVKTAAEIAIGLIDFRKANQANPPIALASEGYGAAADAIHLQLATRQLLDGPHPKDFSDKDFAIFLRCIAAYRQCGGYMDWYDWNCAFWGTKWNAYDFSRISETVITFETAWSAPHPVIEKLAEISKAAFRHEWADEDIGSNAGYRVYADGTVQDSAELSGTKAAYEMAFDLGHADRADFVLVGETYEWRDRESADESADVA